MIILDKHTEAALARALEAYKADPGASRCIYANLTGLSDLDNVQQQILLVARAHITSEQAIAYLCNDGDLFILAPSIPAREFNAFNEDIGGKSQTIPPALLHFYQLSLEVNRLQYIVEQKIDRQMDAQQLEAKRREAGYAERKRRQILSVTQTPQTRTIGIRRSQRTTNEVLVIEDDAFTRKLVDNVLHGTCNVVGVGDAAQAVPTYINTAPDIVFLDINLPDVNGHELLQALLSIDPDAFIVMLSGNADRENIMQAMTHGAHGFIAKPFTREKLLQYLDRCPTLKALVKQ